MCLHWCTYTYDVLSCPRGSCELYDFMSPLCIVHTSLLKEIMITPSINISDCKVVFVYVQYCSMYILALLTHSGSRAKFDAHYIWYKNVE